MNTQDVIFRLRTQSGMSQDELAEKVFVTRQAVSRWETGDTVPGTETLKLLSNLFKLPKIHYLIVYQLIINIYQLLNSKILILLFSLINFYFLILI